MTVARAARVALVLLLLAEAAVLAVGVRSASPDRAWHTEALTLPLFALAVVAFALSQLNGRSALVFVLGAGVLLCAAVIGVRAASSDDANRYIWDAKVQLAGIDPYRYAPTAPQLDRLRDAPLWRERVNCVAQQQAGGLCATINRANVRTIYPPVAQAAFVVARLLALGRTDRLAPVQILASLGVALTTLLLWRRLAERGRPSWLAAVWAWCPMTIVELANNAHIDWLAALLGVAGLLVYASGRSARGGALIGAAVATKVYPVLLLAAVLRRRPVATVSTAVAVVVLSYVPHVLAVGTRVFGYFPSYLKEESYISGRRFLLLRLAIPDTETAKVAAVMLAATALAVAWFSRADRPEDTAVVMFGVALLVTTPNYGWYAVLLLALAALTGRLEWVALAFAASVNTLGAAHFVDGIRYRTWCYGVGMVLVLLLMPLRRWLLSDPRPDPRPEPDQAAVGPQRLDGPA